MRKVGNIKQRRNERRNKERNRKIIIGSLIIAVVVVIISGIVYLNRGENDENTESVNTESETGKDTDNLKESDVQGFLSSDNKITLSDTDLKVESVGSYSGNFLEDGSDEATANVTALRLTNKSDKMLQIAEITFQVNENETAFFKVTDIPAGETVLVLEANKRAYSEKDNYSFGKVASGYMEQPSLKEDKFELVTEKGKITLVNKTEESYDKVYVYYKYTLSTGDYLGGITYRVPFENVPAGGSVEAVAGHFNPKTSEIMAVQIQE